VLTQCYAGVPSVVSFAQSVGATLIGDLAGDGEIGAHDPLLLMVVVCLRLIDGRNVWSLCRQLFAIRHLPSEHERPAHPDRCGGGVLAICGGPSSFAAGRTAVLAQAFDNRRFRLSQGGVLGRLEGAGKEGISGAGGCHGGHASFRRFSCD
jgi:hypothetical protein